MKPMKIGTIDINEIRIKTSRIDIREQSHYAGIYGGNKKQKNKRDRFNSKKLCSNYSNADFS